MPITPKLRYPNDELTVRQQLGLHEDDPLPDGIEEEYETRLGMLHRSGVTGPLRPAEVMNMLRFIGAKIIRGSAKPIPSTPPDWRNVEKDAPVMVNSPDHSGPLYGRFIGSRGNGNISVFIADLDPQVQVFFAKYVKLHHGEMPELPKSTKITDKDWDDVPIGTPLAVITDEGKTVTAMLVEVGPTAKRLTVMPEGGDANTITVDRAKAAVHEEALAAL